MSNVAPRLCADLERACRDDGFRTATAIQARLAPMSKALERETNPGPIKLALSLQRPDLRLPLVAPRIRNGRGGRRGLGSRPRPDAGGFLPRTRADVPRGLTARGRSQPVAGP